MRSCIDWGFCEELSSEDSFKAQERGQPNPDICPHIGKQCFPQDEARYCLATSRVHTCTCFKEKPFVVCPSYPKVAKAAVGLA